MGTSGHHLALALRRELAHAAPGPTDAIATTGSVPA